MSEGLLWKSELAELSAYMLLTSAPGTLRKAKNSEEEEGEVSDTLSKRSSLQRT